LLRVSPVPVQEVHDPCERGDVAVLPDAEIVRGDAAFGKDGGGFREDEANTSDREPLVKRSFGGWSMGFSSVSPGELTKIDGLNDFFAGGSCFSQLDAGRAKKLLAAFSQGRWHAKLTGPVLETV